MYHQGDVVLVPFPFSDLSGSKLRPALIVSRSLVNNTNDLVCLQITSKIFNDNLFFELNRNDVFPALLLKSGIRLHKFFTVNHEIINRKIGTLNNETLKSIITKTHDLVLQYENG